jgi:hypothetical protein
MLSFAGKKGIERGEPFRQHNQLAQCPRVPQCVGFHEKSQALHHRQLVFALPKALRVFCATTSAYSPTLPDLPLDLIWGSSASLWVIFGIS